MTQSINKSLTALVVLAIGLTIGISSCKKDAAPAAKTTYQLLAKDQLGVAGTITFTQTSSTVTTVAIVLTGSDSAYHPAYIRSNSAIEGGNVALTLNNVIGGMSTTQVTALDNGTAINYSQFVMYDGYVDIDESASNQGLILAESDIGGNALTSTSITYTLDTVGAFGVSGTALFSKRVNGNTLVSVSLTGVLAGGMYPEAIHLGSVTTIGGGPVAKTLATIDGTTGKGYTNIRALDDSVAISYSNLLVYDGYLAVQQSPTLPVVVCQGNIGAH